MAFCSSSERSWRILKLSPGSCQAVCFNPSRLVLFFIRNLKLKERNDFYSKKDDLPSVGKIDLVRVWDFHGVPMGPHGIPWAPSPKYIPKCDFIGIRKIHPKMRFYMEFLTKHILKCDFIKILIHTN